MAHILVCPRIATRKIGSLLPAKYIEALEQNQQIAHCCRHPENHEIEAFKSVETEKAPDIYIFHCTCGRRHTRFMIGRDDIRPVWEVA